MKKVIFIYPKKASFINLDIKILSEKYTVIENTYNWTNKIILPFTMLRQLVFLLANIRKTNHILVSFGGYWSVTPVILGKLFKKKTSIILHGTDCAAFDEIKYGNIRSPFLKLALKFSYKHAFQLLPVSQSLVYTENTYFSKTDVIKQGYQHFFPKISTPYTVIHNGIDINRWKNLPNNDRKNNRFITVLSEGQFVRKGGEIILEVANKLPQFEFYFIGIEQPKIDCAVPSNVVFIPKTPPEKLLKYYNSAKYYFQLSIFEGFGVALCEAMASGCIPIVANANIMPQIIGESGYILQKMDVNLLQKQLLEIHQEGNYNKSILAREQIVNNFSIEKRETVLLKAIDVSF